MKLINRILYEELRPHYGALFKVFILIVMVVAAEALAPWPFKVLLDNVLGDEIVPGGTLFANILSFFHSKEALALFVVFVYGFSMMSTSILEFFVSVSMKRLGQKMIFNFSRRAFDNLEQLAVGYYKKKEIGDYIYRLSYDVSALGILLEDGLIPLVTNVLYLATTLAIMFYISAGLAWISLAILPALAIALGIFNRRIGTATKHSEFWNSALFSFIQEILNQLRIVQAFNQQHRQSQVFRQKENQSLVGELNVFGLSFLLNMIIAMIVGIGYAVIILYGIRAVYAGEISAGLLIAYIFYLDNLTNPLLHIMTAASEFRESYVKVSRMSEFFTKKNQIHDTGEIANIEDTAIEFDNVTVYGGGDTVILRNASFKIPRGKKTVIVGVSGSGKTTIASLILRFIDAGAGQVTIGGIPIQEYSVMGLRKQIAYVPQEIILFNDTVYNNITFTDPSYDVARVKYAAKMAIAERFIKRLPGRYDFVVGEEGINLSGGQRQRMMLARAFLRREAKIVIMDEPFSSLDIKTRGTLMENINEFAAGKTTIIISNILEVVKQADYVIIVNEGTILHVGSGASLRKEAHLSKMILGTA